MGEVSDYYDEEEPPAARCDAELYHCECALEVGHDGAHECVCQGSWETDERGETRIVSLPRFF